MLEGDTRQHGVGRAEDWRLHHVGQHDGGDVANENYSPVGEARSAHGDSERGQLCKCVEVAGANCEEDDGRGTVGCGQGASLQYACHCCGDAPRTGLMGYTALHLVVDNVVQMVFKHRFLHCSSAIKCMTFLHS